MEPEGIWYYLLTPRSLTSQGEQADLPRSLCATLLHPDLWLRRRAHHVRSIPLLPVRRTFNPYQRPDPPRYDEKDCFRILFEYLCSEGNERSCGSIALAALAPREEYRLAMVLLENVDGHHEQPIEAI